MKIQITGRQMNVYDETQKLIEKKLTVLDRYFPNEASAVVTLSHRSYSKRVEITIKSGSTMFRGEADGESFRDALDAACNAIDRQIRKNKTKLQRRFRDNTLIFPETPAPDFEEIEEEKDEIIRTKTYSMRPMHPEDAILEMNLSGHEFYAFVMADGGQTAVVYKRKDGGYGLLLPEA